MQQLNIQHSLWSFSARTYYTFRPLSLLTELLTKVVNDKHHRTSVQQTHWECCESHSGFQRPENNFWLLDPSISPWNCFHKFWLACLFRTRTQAPVLLSVDKNKTNTSGRQKKARERQRFCFLILDSSCVLVSCSFHNREGGKEHWRLGKEEN